MGDKKDQKAVPRRDGLRLRFFWRNKSDGVGRNALLPAGETEMFLRCRFDIHIGRSDSADPGNVVPHLSDIECELRGLCNYGGVDISDAVSFRVKPPDNLLQQNQTVRAEKPVVIVREHASDVSVAGCAEQRI